MSCERIADRTSDPGRRRAQAGHTVLEATVVMTLFLLMAGAVGAALGTGGEVYGSGVLHAELDSSARRVLQRILSEVGETRRDSPDFAVGSDYITFNRVEGITATAPVYGPGRIISFDGSTGQIGLGIPSEGVIESLAASATDLTFGLSGSRLTVSLTLERTDAHGQPISLSVGGETNIDP